ncbi:MAG: hypothetical protein VZR06_01365, partial [Butyrivibrio sp.]|nr:hypothetical protein [Butyrivibrio sp.]
YLYSLSAGQKEIFIVFSNQITGMHRYAKLIRIKKCENTHKQVVSTLFTQRRRRDLNNLSDPESTQKGGVETRNPHMVSSMVSNSLSILHYCKFLFIIDPIPLLASLSLQPGDLCMPFLFCHRFKYAEIYRLVIFMPFPRPLSLNCFML